MNLPKNFNDAVCYLKEGRVVAFPTETVYGLGALFDDPKAVQEIFTLKNRPSDNPLIVHISDLEQVKLIAREIPPEFYRLTTHFFPGPLTIVLKKTAAIIDLVSAGQDSVAFRMPSSPIALALIKAVGKPLVAPSANLSGKPSSTSYNHVREDFPSLSCIIDGGACQVGLESTVLSLIDGPVLLRPGIITKEQIESVLQRPVASFDAKKHTITSPGMKHRHYAPKATIHLLDSWNSLPSSAPMVLSISPPPFKVENHFHLTSANLYSLLRMADAKEIASIYVIFDDLLNPALRDRLLRAAQK